MDKIAIGRPGNATAPTCEHKRAETAINPARLRRPKADRGFWDTAHKLTERSESRESGLKRYPLWPVGFDPGMSDLAASIWNMLPCERQGRICDALGQMALHRMRGALVAEETPR